METGSYQEAACPQCSTQLYLFGRCGFCWLLSYFPQFFRIPSTHTGFHCSATPNAPSSIPQWRIFSSIPSFFQGSFGSDSGRRALPYQCTLHSAVALSFSTCNSSTPPPSMHPSSSTSVMKFSFRVMLLLHWKKIPTSLISTCACVCACVIIAHNSLVVEERTSNEIE